MYSLLRGVKWSCKSLSLPHFSLPTQGQEKWELVRYPQYLTNHWVDEECVFTAIVDIFKAYKMSDLATFEAV